MTRYALGVEYSGAAYHGWQRQADNVRTPTVQAALEQALGTVADHAVTIGGCGRTDAGVHAALQIAQFDSSARRTTENWLRGANTLLDRDVRIRWVRAVPDDFEARFAALSRTYLYVIATGAVAPACPAAMLLHQRRPLDAGRMHRAAQFLLGEHDFSAFRAAACESTTPWRRLFRISVEAAGPGVLLRVQANAFLLHMVRNITGSLLAVGRGEQPEEWIRDLLQGGDRTLAAPTARPDGLYLCGAGYPLRFGLPEQLCLPWFLGAQGRGFWESPGR